MKRIAILGTGVAALTAIRELRKQGVDAEITAVSPRDSLVWMPARLRAGNELVVPLAGFMDEKLVCACSGNHLA